MKTISKLSGYTLIEMLAALAIIGSLVLGLVVTIQEMKEDHYFKKTISESLKILSSVEHSRRTVDSTVVSVDGIYTHTYVDLPANASVDDLELVVGQIYISNNNPYGNPYLINDDPKWSEVQTTIDGETSPMQAYTAVYNPGPDETVLTFRANLRPGEDFNYDINDIHSQFFYMQKSR